MDRLRRIYALMANNTHYVVMALGLLCGSFALGGFATLYTTKVHLADAGGDHLQWATLFFVALTTAGWIVSGFGNNSNTRETQINE